MKLRNVISGTIAVLLCELIFTITTVPILVSIYTIGLTVVGIGIFRISNRVIGVITDGKKN